MIIVRKETWTSSIWR